MLMLFRAAKGTAIAANDCIWYSRAIRSSRHQAEPCLVNERKQLLTGHPPG